MDRIESIDDGAYAHFGYQAGRFKDGLVLELMRSTAFVGGYLGIAVLLALIVLLFLMQKRWRAALIAGVSVFLAAGLIEAIRMMVPRPRPTFADQFRGQSDWLGSYPSSSVFLFTLCMVLLGAALWAWLRRPWQRGLYILLAAATVGWICMSGLFLSLHYVTDMIGGLAGAAFVSWIAVKLIVRA